MNNDAVMNIAYHSDYFTTLAMLEAYPDLYTDEFWIEKWNTQYPGRKYFDFHSNQDSFLYAERSSKSKFVLLLNRNSCPECVGRSFLHKNIIYEDRNDELWETLEMYVVDIYKKIVFLPIEIKGRYIVIHETYHINYVVIGYFDSDEEAKNCVENAIIERNVILPKIEEYIIIDIADLCFCFSGLKLERKESDEVRCYTYYSHRFSRYF